MATPSLARRAKLVLRHFAATRSTEVIALQASPFIGCWLGGIQFQPQALFKAALLLFGSLLLTAHVFVFNDWANYETDLRDTRRATVDLDGYAIQRRAIALLALMLFALAIIALALVGTHALTIGAAIATLSVLYSCSSWFGKNTPVLASLNHLLGGTAHFLLGYTLNQGVDARGALVGLFFGLVFAAGHLNQEIRDHDADRLNRLRTSAVVFGCRNAFLASMTLFSVAYALIATLAATGAAPRLLLLAFLPWCLHAIWSVQALRRGLGCETALWLQRRYRLLFAVVGFAFLTR